jgi:hypothetical protein
MIGLLCVGRRCAVVVVVVVDGGVHSFKPPGVGQAGIRGVRSSKVKIKLTSLMRSMIDFLFGKLCRSGVGVTQEWGDRNVR